MQYILNSQGMCWRFTKVCCRVDCFTLCGTNCFTFGQQLVYQQTPGGSLCYGRMSYQNTTHNTTLSLFKKDMIRHRLIHTTTQENVCIFRQSVGFSCCTGYRCSGILKVMVFLSPANLVRTWRTWKETLMLDTQDSVSTQPNLQRSPELQKRLNSC